MNKNIKNLSISILIYVFLVVVIDAFFWLSAEYPELIAFASKWFFLWFIVVIPILAIFTLLSLSENK